MIYGDTSFVLAVYIKVDRFHNEAVRLAARVHEPIPFTLLGELELLNAVHRSLAGKVINQSDHDAILRQIAHDEADGILVRQTLDQIQLFTKARELSRRYTPEVSARSLDILHVASALLLQATIFISFDAKQRSLAQKAGLKFQPTSAAATKT